jgi:D-glycero-D-manno-heptose 1,7-bisphosphate phosphatase
MLDRLDKYGISISGIYYCPHHPQAAVERYRVECGCRKPAIGLFMRAVYELEIDLNQSFAVGDKLRDCAICKSTGCRGFLIGENESPQIIEGVKNGGYRNLRYGKNLLECACEIVGGWERK